MGHSIRSRQDPTTFFPLLRESEALIGVMIYAGCWLMVSKGYCNVLKRSLLRGDMWLFKMNVFRTEHLMEWPTQFYD